MGLISRLVKPAAAVPALPEALQARLAACRLGGADTAQPLLLSRYVVLDLVSEGADPAQHRVNALAALGLRQGVLAPRDAFLVESLPELIRGGGFRLQDALLGLLEHIGTSPVVAWQAAGTARFVDAMLAAHLGCNGQLQWIDLAAILPRLFHWPGREKPGFDDWLAHFGIELPGRLSALPNAVGAARLLQIALAAAAGRGIDTVAQLREFERAFRWPGK